MGLIYGFSHILLYLNCIIVAEERQEQNAKRRKIEAEQTLALKGKSVQPTSASSAHALPARPDFNNFEAAADSLGLGAAPEPLDETTNSALKAINGSAADWVRNRSAIRMANMSAADMLRADMMSARPVKQKPEKKSSSYSPQKPVPTPTPDPVPTPTPVPVPTHTLPPPSPAPVPVETPIPVEPVEQQDAPITLLDTVTEPEPVIPQEVNQLGEPEVVPEPVLEETADSIVVDSEIAVESGTVTPVHGVKRKIDEVIEVGDDDDADADADADAEGEDDEDAPKASLGLKVNKDGSVEQEDTVK